MKNLLHQLNVLRLRAERPSRPDQPPAPGAGVLRFGTAKIVSNSGGGSYVVTEQWWDPSGSGQWADATAPLGYVQASARDCRNRDTGAAGDTVHFWEQRATGGGLEVLIDVTGTDGDDQQAVAAHAGIALAAAAWCDIKDEGTGTLTLSAADWRGRLITHNVAWEAEPISRPLANTADGTFVLDGLANTKVTVVTKNISGDVADVYVDGTDGGKLKVDLTDNGNYGHFALLVQATAVIEPAGS